MIRFLNGFEQGDRRMKGLLTASTALLLLTFFAGAADAQKKPVRKTTPVKNTALVPPLDVRAAREKVDIQLANVNGFVNKLGNVAQPLETADADAKAGRLKPATAERIRANEA